MFVIKENQLKGLVAPIVPYYGTQSEWLQLTEDGTLTTFSDIYRTQPGVRSVVDFIAGHCARMPIRLWKQEGGGTGDSDEGDRVHLRKHPMQKLLNVPNGIKRQGRSSFWDAAWKDFLIYDRVCLVKIKDLETGSPVALVRIPPVWFSPMGQNYWYPDGIRIIGNRGQEDIAIENVVYIHGYDPADPRIGVSPMMTLKGILEEEAAGSAWRSRFWDQGVQQSMIVTRPVEAPDWDDGARDRFITSLRAASSRGKPLLLEEGMASNPSNSFDPKSAEYIQTKKFTRDEVLRVYNLPVGLFEQGSSSNIAQFRAMLYSETLAPIIGRFVDELEAQLLTEWSDDPYDDGLFLEPGIEEKVRGNVIEQLAMLLPAVGGPLMTRAEGRKVLNLTTLPEDQKAEKLLAPGNMTIAGEAPPPGPGGFGGAPGDPVASVPKNPANQNGPANPPTENDTATRADESTSRNTNTREGGAAGAGKAKARPARAQRTRERFVKEVDARLQKFVERQRATVASQKGAKADAPFDKKRWNRELKKELVEAKRPIVDHYGQEWADEFNSEWDEGQVEAYLETGSEYQAENINAFTAGALLAAVTAAEVSGVFDSLSARLSGEAIDTTNHMAAFGGYEAARQSGKTVEKVWSVASGNPRPSHSAQDGETVPLDEKFSNGLRFPHDPSGDPDETAGCKCEMTLVAKDAE